MMNRKKMMTLALTAALGCTAQAAHASPLVAHYTLDDTGNTILDSSGNGLHGTRSMAGYSTDDKIEGSASAWINNNSHVIDLGNPEELRFQPGVDEFTISMWFKLFGDEADGTLIGRGPASSSSRDYQLFIEDLRWNNRQRINYIAGGAAAESSVDVDPDMWHHTILSVSSEGVDFYVNGVKEADGAPVGNAFNEELNTFIGARTDGQSFVLQNGLIDDVQIYDIALNESQASYLWNDGAGNTVVPEPGSLVLLGAGAGLMLMRRRK